MEIINGVYEEIKKILEQAPAENRPSLLRMHGLR